METKTPTWRSIALPLAFALACTALMIAAWLSFGGSVPLEPKGYRIGMRVAEAPNLVAGADVQIAGVDVGHVVSVDRARGAAEITLELESQYAPVRSNATAIPRFKTLLGEGYIELAPGSRRAAPVPDGGELPADRVRDNQQLDEVLETFSADTRRELRGLLAGTARAFRGRSHEISDALGHAAPATANLAALLHTVDGQRHQLQTLLARSGDVLSALGQREGSLQGALDAGNRLLDATGRRHRELAATVAAFPPFLRQLTRTSHTLDTASGDLGRTVSALQPAAPQAAPALRAISASAPEFEALFRRLPATIRAGNRGLPSLTRLARDASPTLSQAYDASRELIPIAALLSADREDAIGILANVSNVMNGIAIGPGGDRVGYGTGLATIWNEAIGGYKKKLPTNRPNPYPRPGALKLKPLGHLKSFQCRHTGNVLYVPPTGDGVPPCVEQGPWEFRGRSQYFPRLLQAAP